MKRSRSWSTSRNTRRRPLAPIPEEPEVQLHRGRASTVPHHGRPSDLSIRATDPGERRTVRLGVSGDVSSRAPLDPVGPPVCPLCDETFPSRALRRHLDSQHLPWYVEPDRACYRCRVHVNTQSALRCYHGTHAPHLTENGDLQDSWLRLISEMLDIVNRDLGLANVDCLLDYVLRNKLYPTESNDQHPGARQTLFARTFADHIGIRKCSTYCYKPPNDVACLILRPVLRQIVKVLSEGARDKLMGLTLLDVNDIYAPSPSENETRPWVIDAHAHLDRLLRDWPADSWDAVQQALAPAANLRLALVVHSASFTDSWSCLPLLLTEENVMFTIGVHPHLTGTPIHDRIIREQDRYLQHRYCIGFGEVGLDYSKHHHPATQRQQRDYLYENIPKAVAAGKPLVLHCRGAPRQAHKARQDLLHILTQLVPRGHHVYVHSFCEDDLDGLAEWTASFDHVYFGVGLKRPAAGVLEAIRIDRLLVESDAPMQYPSPFRLREVVSALARIHGLPIAMMADRLRLNARTFYRILEAW